MRQWPVGIKRMSGLWPPLVPRQRLYPSWAVACKWKVQPIWNTGSSSGWHRTNWAPPLVIITWNGWPHLYNAPALWMPSSSGLTGQVIVELVFHQPPPFPLPRPRIIISLIVKKCTLHRASLGLDCGDAKGLVPYALYLIPVHYPVASQGPCSG